MRSSPITLRSLAPLLLLLALPLARVVDERGAQRAATTVVLVRHAERAADHPTDPDLTAEGRSRAVALRDALRDAPVRAIYVTQYRRTHQTAAPLAAALGLTPTVVATDTTGSTEAWAAGLARALLARHAGETVVVVGHQGTTVAMVEALTGKTVPPIPVEEYDRLLVVSSTGARSGGVVAGRYGRPAP